MITKRFGGPPREFDVLLDQNDGDAVLRLRRMITSSICSTMLGWMPSVGSSSRTIFGFGEQRAGDGELLLLAAGQIAAVADRGIPSGSGTGRRPSRRARPRAGLRRAKVPSIRFSRTVNLRQDAAALRHVADAGLGALVGRQSRRFRRRRAGSLPSTRSIRPRMRAHQRGLADAVAAEHAKELALADLRVERPARRGCCRRRHRHC